MHAQSFRNKINSGFYLGKMELGVQQSNIIKEVNEKKSQSLV